MAHEIQDLCRQAVVANRQDKYRRDNIIELPPSGSAVITGDLHGHRRNFGKIVSHCDLGSNPDRHVIIQEIIHGGPEDDCGGCLSFELLFDVLQYKNDFPDQVHIIMANHDTATITNSDVTKGGKEMNLAMKEALKRKYPDDFLEVHDAIRDVLRSQPLAARTQNGIWISHSLPADRFMEDFDTEVFHREYTNADLERHGSAYILTWGRRHSEENLDKLANLFDCSLFILGHQHQQKGWSMAGDNLIIIASDHNHGCLLEFNLETEYTAGQLCELIKPLAAIE